MVLIRGYTSRSNCRRSETEVSGSLRICYPLPHYLILCQEGQRDALRRVGVEEEGGWGGGLSFLAGVEGRADTHVVSEGDTKKHRRRLHAGRFTPSYCQGAFPWFR